MISVKFECPFCNTKKVETDSFGANCEHCGAEVEFELLMKQISTNNAVEAKDGK